MAIVGSGPSGLINAYLLAAEGFPVTVFEAFHALGGVLRYGIPEFRLPNDLIDDVVGKIRLLGGRFVQNFVVGKTATLQDLRDAGFHRIFVGTGAGLPRFMNVPGEHLLNVMTANEFLTRVNLMQGLRADYETPLPETKGKQVLVIGGGNTAMDAARTAQRLGGNVTIVYRRTRSEMPARVEELHHALEEGIALRELCAPSEFLGDDKTGFVTAATLEIMELGEPDESGRRRPIATGRTETMHADLVIMALGNAANPIIKDSEPRLNTSKWGTIVLDHAGSQETTLEGVFTGGDAARGGSTAIAAAGDGRAAAHEILGEVDLPAGVVRDMVARALEYTELGTTAQRILARSHLSDGIEEFTVSSPLIAAAAQAGQFVRLLPRSDGELIPLTLADWDVEAGTICLVVQGVGTSSIEINAMEVGDAFTGIAGPLGRPSEIHSYGADETVVFTAGGLGLPPVYPIMREHLRRGNHVTLISGFRSADLMFWTGPDERVGRLQAEFGDQLDVIYTTNDGSFGVPGFVTGPLQEMLEANQRGEGRTVAEVVTIGPPMMMRAVSDLSMRFGTPCVAQPELDHGRRHRHVRGVHGAGRHRREDDPQARVHRRPGDRLAHHRLGQVPAAVRPVPRTGGRQQDGARAGLRVGLMGMPSVAGVAGLASGLADRAVEAYRTRLEAQIQRRRIDSLQVSMLVNASLAAVGMAVDVVALQVRIHALQQALDEAVAAGDLESAEELRGQQVAMLKEPQASARLMATLAEYIPAVLAGQTGRDGRVIEGDVV